MTPPADEPATLSAETERLQQELKHVRAELEEFTYSVSHDLRASLRHVSAYVQIIHEELAGQANAEILGYLNTVSQAAQTMSRQIEALGALSRLGRVEVHWGVVNPNDLVADAMNDIVPTLGEAPLVWQVAADIPPLWGDAALIEQVFSELLSNAVKFTQNEPQAQVALSWALNEHGHCVITVSDNGVGFNPQYQSKLFQAFQRLHSPRDFAGMGIGLAKCRKIMERLGGDIWADGALNAGCRVSFTLPLAHLPR